VTFYNSRIDGPEDTLLTGERAINILGKIEEAADDTRGVLTVFMGLIEPRHRSLNLPYAMFATSRTTCSQQSRSHPIHRRMRSALCPARGLRCRCSAAHAALAVVEAGLSDRRVDMEHMPAHRLLLVDAPAPADAGWLSYNGLAGVVERQRRP
jgi:hypothetical protein